MTLEEAKQLATEVVDGKARSNVGAALALSRFVLGLPSPQEQQAQDDLDAEDALRHHYDHGLDEL